MDAKDVRSLSSTSSEPTDRRRSQILTSPSLTRAVVAVEDAEVDVVEVAVVAAEDAGVDAKDVTGPVRIAVIGTDPVKTAAMTAAMIAVRTVAMDLVQAVAPADPGAEEAAEARRNSAWTRRPSLLWARLPLKVKESKSKLLLFHPERILIIDPIS